MNEEVRAFDVEVVDLVKVVFGGGFEIFHRQDAGVRNEDVNLAKVLHGSFDQALDSANTTCIRLHGNGTAGANFFHDLIGSGGVRSVVDYDRGSILSETDGRGFTDAWIVGVSENVDLFYFFGTDGAVCVVLEDERGVPLEAPVMRATLPESAPRDIFWNDSVMKEDESWMR